MVLLWREFETTVDKSIALLLVHRCRFARGLCKLDLTSTALSAKCFVRKCIPIQPAGSHSSLKHPSQPHSERQDGARAHGSP